MNSNPLLLSDATYNKLKWLVAIALPAFATFYGAVGTSLGLPDTDKVVYIIVALTAFLGTLLGVSTKKYNNSDEKYDGEMVLTKDDDGAELFSLELNDNPDQLKAKNEISFKVKTENS